MGGGQYKEGRAVTLTAVPNEGWRFVNWTENGSAVSTDAEYSFTASADRSLTANFEPIPTTCYTVSASANPTEGGTVSGAGEYERGATVTLSAVPNEGWRFVNWTENGSAVSTDAEFSFTAEADRNLTANFEPIPTTCYTVSASANPTEGGTVTGAGEYAEGETVTLRATPNEGWRFVNWTENGSAVSTSPSYSFPAAANRSLTANFEAFTGQPVSYLDPTDEANPNKICENYALLTDQTALETGWYVVNADTTISERITVAGDVRLILVDGCTLTAPKGVNVSEGNSFTVYAQSEGSAMGTLLSGTTDGTDVTCAYRSAGIGGGQMEGCGTVTVNGGVVTANSNNGGAAIGGGYGGNGGTVTINGGIVTADGGTPFDGYSDPDYPDGAAGIGAGKTGNSGTIIINGGTVTAYGGGNGAGIGGSKKSSGVVITINGGVVIAVGGSMSAGIGGSYRGNEISITISGGTVNATGGYCGAGIGCGKRGGYESDCGTITITGGTITATGGLAAAGIGGGHLSTGGAISISGGTVIATAGEYDWEYGVIPAQAVGHGQTVDEENGTLTIPGMKVYASEEATEPVAAADRMETCDSPWARLELCDPHCCDENNFCIWCGTAGPVAYLDPTDEADPDKICDNYTLLTNQTALETGWYVVNADTTISERITVTGEVHLILVDGCTLTAPKGITVNEGNSFTVYAQSDGDGMGALFAGTADGTDATCEEGLAGIGSASARAGAITINGGAITARGGNDRGAGIGGSQTHSITTITINAGHVTAVGANHAAGIGNGPDNTGADAGKITINGGVVTASSVKNGAGIGGGTNGVACEVEITGGTVTADGGKFAAAIGGGKGSSGGRITINDGYVTATGVYGAGIGGGSAYDDGKGGDGGTVTITGGVVTAIGSGWAAGIGGGSATGYSGSSTNGGAGGTVLITGGEVYATGGQHAAGIGGANGSSGGPVTVTGGTVVAQAGGSAQAIGGGERGADSGSLTLGAGLRGYNAENAAEPVAAADRIDSCRGSWAKLTPCEPHNDYYVDNGETHTAVCAWCGVEGEPVSHSYGEASYTWEPDGSACSAAHSCTLCQHEQTEAGSVSAQVTLQPTCTEYGKTSYTAVFTTQGFETQTLILTNVEPFGHDLIHHDAQAPTCTEIGWEAYDACSRCDYTTYVELEALGHDLIHHDAQAPTCTEIGWQAYDTCSRCDYTTYVELDALGHDLIHHDAQAPSCTEIGWQAYDTCSRCDYTTYEELDALGHVWEVQDYVWSEDFTTCTATAVCARDGSHIQTETVNAVFVLTKPSTFESTGTGYYAAAFENELFEAQTQEVIVPEVACAGGEACPSGHFTDLPPITSYAHIPIDWAVVNRITGGTSPTTFGPEQSCTRSQFVMFLWCVMGRPEPAAENNPFKDVKPSDYFYKAVLWAVENGITAGTSADTFSPKMVVTRAQVVTFIWHNEGDQTAAQTENLFEDVRAGDYYHDAVLWAVERGVTAGTSATTFSPSAICTRAQCMTFLYRVYGMDG